MGNNNCSCKCCSILKKASKREKNESYFLYKKNIYFENDLLKLLYCNCCDYHIKNKPHENNVIFYSWNKNNLILKNSKLSNKNYYKNYYYKNFKKKNKRKIKIKNKN